MRILVVEDDRGLVALLRDGLEGQGFKVTTARTVAEGRMSALTGSFVVIVLDLILPDGSGRGLCEQLRSRGIETPILMLTSLGDLDSRVGGLEAGADDYLTKPFAMAELYARARALARRQPVTTSSICSVADLEVDFSKRQVHRGDLEIVLTAREFELLAVLARNTDRIVTRAEITAEIWDENHDPLSNAVEVLVRRLRLKIDDGRTTGLIHTVRGAGYRLVEP